MCIIIEKNQPIQINAAWHAEFWQNNSDGFGVVEYLPDMPMGERVRVTKTMSEREAWAIIERLNQSETDAIIHYRMATHGTKGLDMCHPFVLDSAAGPVAITHNGVLHNYPRGEGFDARQHSDTYAFVHYCIKPMIQTMPADVLREFLRSDGFRHLIDDRLGSGNRLVITDQFGHVTFNDDIWHLRTTGSLAGLRLSNTYAWDDIDRPRVTKVSSPSSTWLSDDEWERQWDAKYGSTWGSKGTSTNVNACTLPAQDDDDSLDVSSILVGEAYDWMATARVDNYYDALELVTDDPELAAYALWLALRDAEQLSQAS